MLIYVVIEMMMEMALGIGMSALVGLVTYFHMEGYVEDFMAKVVGKMVGVKI